MSRATKIIWSTYTGFSCCSLAGNQNKSFLNILGSSCECGVNFSPKKAQRMFEAILCQCWFCARGDHQKCKWWNSPYSDEMIWDDSGWQWYPCPATPEKSPPTPENVAWPWWVTTQKAGVPKTPEQAPALPAPGVPKTPRSDSGADSEVEGFNTNAVHSTLLPTLKT